MEQEQKPITAILEQVAEEMCDKYCKYPGQMDMDEMLNEICDECPLVKFF